jgi:hypothetical protein
MRNTILIRISPKDKAKIAEIKNKLHNVKPDISDAQVLRLISIDVDLGKLEKRLKESKVMNIWE